MVEKFKPPPDYKPATPYEFFEAISRADLSAVVEVLRRLDGLSRPELQTLADILAGDPATVDLYPVRFQLSKRRGKVDVMSKWADVDAIVRAVESAQNKFTKREAAIAEVIKRSEGRLSRAKIFRALREHKKKKSQSLTNTQSLD